MILRFLAHKKINAFPLHLSSWNFIQGLPMSRGCALLILGSKGQGHNALITENGLWCIIAFPLHVLSWNFTQRPHVSRMCPFDFGIQGQSALITENGWRCIIAFPLHLFIHRLPVSLYIYYHETSYNDCPWLEDVPYWYRGSWSRSQCFDNWK